MIELVLIPCMEWRWHTLAPASQRPRGHDRGHFPFICVHAHERNPQCVKEKHALRRWPHQLTRQQRGNNNVGVLAKTVKREMFGQDPHLL